MQMRLSQSLLLKVVKEDCCQMDPGPGRGLQQRVAASQMQRQVLKVDSKMVLPVTVHFSSCCQRGSLSRTGTSHELARLCWVWQPGSMQILIERCSPEWQLQHCLPVVETGQMQMWVLDRHLSLLAQSSPCHWEPHAERMQRRMLARQSQIQR